MSHLYRELAEKSADHHDAYIRMAVIIEGSNQKVVVNDTELAFITEELTLATEQFNNNTMSTKRFNTILGEHVECLEAWVNRAYIK